MASAYSIIPFIKFWEGGYVNNPADPGGETNKGITYETWKSYFGDTHSRFIAMSDADWMYIFKKGFWDEIKGDQIRSQKVADAIVNWFWGSGYYAIREVQNIVGAVPDGIMGAESIRLINKMNPDLLFHEITVAESNFYRTIVEANPGLNVFFKGWMNRLDALISKNSGFALVGVSIIILSGLFFAYRSNHKMF